jgi:site-specific recombinase XerD
MPCFPLCRRPVRKITREEVEDYKRDRVSQGKAPATVNREVSTMKTLLSWAVEEKYLPVNPLAAVKMLEEKNEKMWILSYDDEDKLLAACDKSPQRKGGNTWETWSGSLCIPGCASGDIQLEKG